MLLFINFQHLIFLYNPESNHFTLFRIIKTKTKIQKEDREQSNNQQPATLHKFLNMIIPNMLIQEKN